MPIAAGALIQSSEVGPSADALQLSFSLDRSHALGGTLRPGEHVDILGTFGTGASSYTAVMAGYVLVLSAVPSGDSELISVAVPDVAVAEAVADATSAVSVTLVRSPIAAPIPPPYHPPADR